MFSGRSTVDAHLNPVEQARACAMLKKELGLTYQQIGARVGCHKASVANLMRLLQLSDEILEFVARGELDEAHGRALLIAKDPEARRELARRTIEEGWSTRELQARARKSNEDVPSSQDGVPAPACEREQGPCLDLAVQNVARAWGDVLGVEVQIRTMARGRGQVRLEVPFSSAESALALADRLSAAIVGDGEARS